MSDDTNDLVQSAAGMFHKPVAGIRREQSKSGATPHIEELEITFTDRDVLPVIFKNFASTNDAARTIEPAFLYDPRREIGVYEWILHASHGETAKLYGSIVEPSVERYWLFLEKVPGRLLREYQDFEIRLEIARWLAHFHSSVDASRARLLVPQLIVQDAAFFSGWLDYARKNVKNKLESIAVRYRAILDVLTSLPRAFIHGEFYPSNILINHLDGNVRICPIDWEFASVGPGFMDVAALASGSWTEEQRTRIAETYTEACSPALKPSDPKLAFDCCRLQVAIQWLGWPSAWPSRVERAHDWLADVLTIASAEPVSKLLSRIHVRATDRH